MNSDNRARCFGQHLFQESWIKIMGRQIRLDRYRTGTYGGNGKPGRDTGVGWNNDLMTVPDVIASQDQLER